MHFSPKIAELLPIALFDLPATKECDARLSASPIVLSSPKSAENLASATISHPLPSTNDPCAAAVELYPIANARPPGAVTGTAVFP